MRRGVPGLEGTNTWVERADHLVFVGQLLFSLINPDECPLSKPPVIYELAVVAYDSLLVGPAIVRFAVLMMEWMVNLAVFPSWVISSWLLGLLELSRLLVLLRLVVVLLSILQSTILLFVIQMPGARWIIR